jgi:hypothetical protein
MSSYFPIWCSNKFNGMQFWFLTGFSRTRQKIGILSFFHPKMYSIEKYLQSVKLPTRSQTRRVKLYSIESQNQVDFCCLIYFSFVTTVLEKQIQKECDLRNRALPPFVTLLPFVSDCIPETQHNLTFPFRRNRTWAARLSFSDCWGTSCWRTKIGGRDLTRNFTGRFHNWIAWCESPGCPAFSVVLSPVIEQLQSVNCVA